MSHYLTDQLTVFNQQHEEFLSAGATSRLPDEARHYRIVESRNRRAEEYRSYITDALNLLNQVGSLKPTSRNEGTLEQQVSNPPSTVQRNQNLTHRQIALLYIYEDTLLDEALATEVGKHHGHKSATTGRKIMTDHYYPLRGKANNRTGVEGKIAITNMIKAIKGVIQHLSEDKRQQAEDELQALEAKK